MTRINRYATRNDAIFREIVAPIEATNEALHDEYDIDAIADEVLGHHEAGYALQVDTETFWKIVEKHERENLYLG